MADGFKVPFIDLQMRYEEEREEILACVDRVLSKGHLVLTEEVFEFERKVCGYTGARHCISLNSGTDALMIGLWAMGTGRGDEVITPPVSFVASTGSIAHIGATPVRSEEHTPELKSLMRTSTAVFSLKKKKHHH